MTQPFLGEIRLFTWNWAPRGWALCQGQIMPISQNTALYSLLGTYYGGNGSSTFGLPDLRGRVPISMGQYYVMGEQDGQENVTLTLATMPAHNHVFSGTQNTATAKAPTGHFLAGISPNTKFGYAPSTTPVALDPTSISMVGGGQPHDNMQPYLVMNFCIATSGIYPARN